VGRIEQGIVRVVERGFAEVLMQPASADACSTCGTCGEGPQGRLLRVPAVPGVEPGRRVSVEVPEEEGDLKAALVVFLIPVLAIVLGAVVGSAAMADRTAGACLGAFALLVPAVLLVRWYDRRRGRAVPTARIVRLEE
jgi:positive regulator of sigma E activity